MRSPPCASTVSSNPSTAESKSTRSSGFSPPVTAIPRSRSRAATSAAAAARSSARWGSRLPSSSSYLSMPASPLQGPPQGGRQRPRVAGLLVATAVDEEHRGPAHPARDAAQEVFPHPRPMRVCGELRPHPLRVEPELARVGHQIGIRERRLPLIQEIVHLPELPLRAGRFRDLSRVLGVRMLLLQGKVAKHEAHLRPEVLEHPLQLGVGAAAERALEISVLHKRHGSSRCSPC